MASYNPKSTSDNDFLYDLERCFAASTIPLVDLTGPTTPPITITSCSNTDNEPSAYMSYYYPVIVEVFSDTHVDFTILSSDSDETIDYTGYHSARSDARNNYITSPRLPNTSSDKSREYSSQSTSDSSSETSSETDSSDSDSYFTDHEYVPNSETEDNFTDQSLLPLIFQTTAVM